MPTFIFSLGTLKSIPNLRIIAILRNGDFTL